MLINDGTWRVTVTIGARKVSNLHVCANCLTILRVGFAQDGPAGDCMVIGSATPWAGPCDLCVYTATLSAMLQTGEVTVADA